MLVLGDRAAVWGLVVTGVGGLKVCAQRLDVTGKLNAVWLEAVLRTCRTQTHTETRRDGLRFHFIAAMSSEKPGVCLKQHSCIKNAMLSKTDVSETHNTAFVIFVFQAKS